MSWMPQLSQRRISGGICERRHYYAGAPGVPVGQYNLNTLVITQRSNEARVPDGVAALTVRTCRPALPLHTRIIIITIIITARWPFVSLGRYSRQPISCFLRQQSSHRRRYSGRYDSHQKNREILDPILSIQVRAYSSPWHLQFHNSELHFRTRPPNLCSHRRCERNFVLIPTHFYHATTLQLCAFARHSAS